MIGVGVGPLPTQKPVRKAGGKRVPATDEQIAAFETANTEFEGNCNQFSRPAGPTAPITKEAVLKYRRGDHNAVLGTPHARAALEAAYGTGTDWTSTTVAELSMMDTKVRAVGMDFKVLHPVLDLG